MQVYFKTISVIKKIIWLLAISVMSVNVYGQEGDSTQQEKGSLDGGSLKSQYEYMVEESNNYQEFKVIKKDWATKFGRNLSDSLDAIKIELDGAASLAIMQVSTIDGLENELATTRDSLKISLSEKSNMAWLGVDMHKSSYRILMWSVIGVLTLLLIIIIFILKNNNATTRDAKAKFENLDEEFADYKKRSLEREQKLRRELQDEINKQKTK